MALPASAIELTQRKREREDIQRRRKDFDEALEELRRAKMRLQKATDLYLERLEGTRDKRTR